MFKILWDKPHHGGRLTWAPPSGEALNVAPRPVFWKEFDFPGLDKLGWKCPHSDAPLLRACDRRYFFRDKWVLKVSGGDLFESHSISFCIDNSLELKPIYIERLRDANEDSLFLWEHEAMEFIDVEIMKI